MPNRLVFDGLEELKAELRALPAALHLEARGIVALRAERAKAEIEAGYAVRTGNLRKGLRIRDLNPGPLFAAYELRNNAPHAWLYDNGSQLRHKVSGASTGAMWGKTPPTHLFVRTMIKHRREMYRELADLLTRHGLTVIGEAA